MNRQQLLARLKSQPEKKPPVREEHYSEQHYRVNELSKLWNLSPTTITNLFRNAPGVVHLGRTEGNPGKRRYATMLIPASVAKTVHEGMASPPAASR